MKTKFGIGTLRKKDDVYGWQELSTKRAARESHNEAVFEMDVIPEDAEGESRKSSTGSRKGAPSVGEELELQQGNHYKIAEKLLSSRATQNWFFQNATHSSTTAADGAADVTADVTARKAKEFHMWSPQTM